MYNRLAWNAVNLSTSAKQFSWKKKKSEKITNKMILYVYKCERDSCCFSSGCMRFVRKKKEKPRGYFFYFLRTTIVPFRLIHRFNSYPRFIIFRIIRYTVINLTKSVHAANMIYHT